jgi:hypothetical protein
VKPRIEVLHSGLSDSGADVVVNPTNHLAAIDREAVRTLVEACGEEVLEVELGAALRATGRDRMKATDCLVTSGGRSARIRHVLHVAATDESAAKRVTGADGRVQLRLTNAERVMSCTRAALERVTELALSAGRPLSVAFPLLGVRPGGLAPNASIASIITETKLYFAEISDPQIARVLVAVPDRESFELASSTAKRIP